MKLTITTTVTGKTAKEWLHDRMEHVLTDKQVSELSGNGEVIVSRGVEANTVYKIIYQKKL